MGFPEGGGLVHVAAARNVLVSAGDGRSAPKPAGLPAEGRRHSLESPGRVHAGSGV